MLEALALLDEQEDVNKILQYFSYEHFYVIYCKFWELDSDHNFLLSQEDLLRYGNHALTYRIVDRIFSQVTRAGAACLSLGPSSQGAVSWIELVAPVLAIPAMVLHLLQRGNTEACAGLVAQIQAATLGMCA